MTTSIKIRKVRVTSKTRELANSLPVVRLTTTRGEEEITTTIYKIINDINDKVYIGQTRNKRNRFYEVIVYENDVPVKVERIPYLTSQGTKDRFINHITKSEKDLSTAQIHKAISELGKEHFKIEDICECSLLDADDLEREYIEKYNSIHPNGYNMHKGGEKHSTIQEKINLYKGKRISNVHVKKHNDVGFMFIFNILCDDKDSKEVKIQFASDKQSTVVNLARLYYFASNIGVERQNIFFENDEERKVQDMFVNMSASDKKEVDKTVAIGDYKNKHEKIIEEITTAKITHATLSYFLVKSDSTKNKLAIIIHYENEAKPKPKKKQKRIVRFGGTSIALIDAHKDMQEFINKYLQGITITENKSYTEILSAIRVQQ